MPLLPVREYCHWNANVERIFKKLFFSAFALADLFDLNKNNRFIGGMAKGKINTFARNGVFWGNDLGIIGWPRQCL